MRNLAWHVIYCITLCCVRSHGSRAFRRSLPTILSWILYSCLGRRTNVLSRSQYARTRILIHKVFNYTYMEMFYAHRGKHRLHCHTHREATERSRIMFHLAVLWIETFRVCDRLVYHFKCARCTLYNSIHTVYKAYNSVMWCVNVFVSYILYYNSLFVTVVNKFVHCEL